MMVSLVVDAQKKSVKAVVVPESNYVLRGGKYKAKIVPVDEELSKNVRVFVNNKELPNGVYTATAAGLGIKRFNGYMLFGNDTVHYPFSGEYTVDEPTCTILNMETNGIVYRGYENKIRVSVPGISNNLISVEAKGAIVENKQRYWAVTPTDSTRVVNISVYATINKAKQVMGQYVYRIKNLPTPIPSFDSGRRSYDGNRVNDIAKADLLNSTGRLYASYGENGIIDVDFKVIDFRVQAGSSYIQCEGDKFTEEVITQISALRAGELVLIDNIRVQSPKGHIISVPFLLFRVR